MHSHKLSSFVEAQFLSFSIENFCILCTWDVFVVLVVVLFVSVFTQFLIEVLKSSFIFKL